MNRRRNRDRRLGALLVLTGLIGLGALTLWTARGGRGIRWGHPFGAMHSPAYTRIQNPLSPTPEVLIRGRDLYQKYCAACHGLQGRGDGPAGQGLVPPPTALIVSGSSPMVPEGYLYWRIREGGQRFQTAMPAFRDILSEEDIWSVVTYIRAGFPDLPPTGEGWPQASNPGGQP